MNEPCREPHRDAVSSTFHHDASPPHPPCHRSATPLMHAAHNGHMPTLEVRPAAAEDVLLEGGGRRLPYGRSMYYRGGGAPSLCPAAAENVLLEEGGRHGYLLEPANPLLRSTSGGLPSAEDATLPGLPTSPLKTRRTLAAPRKELFPPPPCSGAPPPGCQRGGCRGQRLHRAHPCRIQRPLLSGRAAGGARGSTGRAG